MLSADERAGLRREVVLAGALGSQGRELRHEISVGELEQADGLADVLQPLWPEVEPAGSVGQAVRHAGGSGRHEHLPSVPDRPDAGGLVHRHPHDGARDRLDLADVHPHPHTDRRARRPLVGGERALPSKGRSHRITRPGEDDEEGITLRPLHLASVGEEGRREEGSVLDQHGAVVRAELLQEARRALDVAEQEANRRGGHAVGRSRSSMGKAQATAPGVAPALVRSAPRASSG